MRKAWLTFWVGIVFLFSLPSQGLAANFTWTLGADTNDTRFNNVDGGPGLFHDGSDLWVVYTDGSNNVIRWKGTTMDDLVKQSNGIRDSSFTQPDGDDRYWLIGTPYVDASGNWHMTAHVEFHYESPCTNNCHFRKIGMASSTDKGATWHYDGDILTGDNSVLKSDYQYSNYYFFGLGDQKTYIDTAGGYMYIFYQPAWVIKQNVSPYTGLRYDTIRVARSQLSSGLGPDTWQKWYNGAWGEAGLGGHDSDILPGAGSATIFYDSYLSKFVALGYKVDGHPGSFSNYISTATDLGTQNWTTPEKINTYNDSTSSVNSLLWYNWVVDPTTWSGDSMGQTYRIYSADNAANSGLRTSKYMNMTFNSGTTSSVTIPGVFPLECVNDVNPGWCSNTWINDNTTGTGLNQINYQNGVWSYGNPSNGDSCVSCYNHDEHLSNIANADFTFQFNGSGIKLYQSKSAVSGIEDIYIDGEKLTSVDLYRANKQMNIATYMINGLSSTQTHTLKVVVTGQKNANATDAYINIDKIEVLPTSSTVDDGNSNITYTGSGWFTWSDSNSYGGSQHYTTQTNDYMTYTFTGTSISWSDAKNTNRAKVDVYIDNNFQTTIDEFGPLQYQQNLYEITGLPSGSHTIKLVNTGTKNANSTGTYMGVDFFTVNGATGTKVQDNASSRISYTGSGGTSSGSWFNWMETGQDGSAKYTTAANDQAVFTFTGTQVAWYEAKGPNHGQVDVYLDDNFIRTVDEYNSSFIYQQPVFSASGLSNQLHTLKLIAKGTHNTSSTNYYVGVDYFSYK